jgi:hypothetical protein
MSKGTPIVGVRIAPELRKRLEAAVERRRLHPDGETNISKMVTQAIVKHLDHLDRSRAKRSERKRQTPRKPRLRATDMNRPEGDRAP